MKLGRFEIEPRNLQTDEDPRPFVIHFSKPVEKFFKRFADEFTFGFILVLFGIFVISFIHDNLAQLGNTTSITAAGLTIIILCSAYLLGKQFIKQDKYEKQLRKSVAEDTNQGDDTNGKGEES